MPTGRSIRVDRGGLRSVRLLPGWKRKLTDVVLSYSPTSYRIRWLARKECESKERTKEPDHLVTHQIGRLVIVKVPFHTVPSHPVGLTKTAYNTLHELACVLQPPNQNITLPRRNITLSAMASITHQYTYPIRPLPIRPNRTQSASKGLQWTSPYDNVFSQYVRVEGLETRTCNPAALAYPIPASNEPSPVAPSIYPDPSQHRLWSANSFDAKDIHQPSPTFNPWMGHESETNIRGPMRSQPISRLPIYQNDMSTAGLRISYDPTLAPSRVEETASEMFRSRRQSRTPSTSRRQQRTPSSGTPSPRRRQRRTPSSKGHSRKSSGQAQSPRGSCSSFVNYTPHDSEKLLTGVAPSGSSKTKARREREAVEKRRRFSQAALKAVVKAGGDLAELRDAGLVIG
jgi:hypothetical protein